MNNSAPKSSIVANIKLYIFPALVTVISMLIWRDISELRSDVKSLLAQSNVDKTKIDNLTNDVRMLEEVVFNKRLRLYSSLYILKHDPLFKLEEEYDVKKYLKTI